MSTPEKVFHAFIVRFWLEPREIDAPAEWRGVIEHVLDGERKYVCGLDEINDFISTYIRDWGAKDRIPESDPR